MAVYVDDEMIEWRGRHWCHLVADTLDELHAFAAQLGLRREWFQGNGRHPHYDVTSQMRIRALARGALEGDRTTIIECTAKLRRERDEPAGLRMQAALAL